MLSSLQSDSSSKYRPLRRATFSCLLATSLSLLAVPLVHASLPTAQHNALVDLYNSTSGAAWTNRTNWTVAADECTWYGVTCDAAHTTVQGLQITGNNLKGSLPGSLGNLTGLQSLNLAANQISGSIPSQLFALSSLHLINLNLNQLSGPIPAQLSSLFSLQNLYLNSNQFSGSIPPQLSSLTGLQGLFLSDNQLSGSIPSELASLVNLQSLVLGINQLSGSIPPQLTNLPMLQNLGLNDNQLSGSIPPQLGNLTSLQFLYLSRNRLSGGVPPQLGNLTGLINLWLSGNQLSGSIPSALTNLTHLLPGNATEIRWNALYSTDPSLTAFLNSKQDGGDWQSTQTIAPTNLSTSGATANAITVNWTPIAYTADGGSYQVWYAPTAGGPYTPFVPATSSKSSSSLTVTGLATNTTYYFVINATTPPNGNNSNTVTSGFSTEVSGRTSTQSLPPVVNTFAANPPTITAGQSSTLSWTTSNATAVTITGVIGAQPTSSSVPVTPTVTTTYTLTATGTGTPATAMATVVVNPAPQAPGKFTLAGTPHCTTAPSAVPAVTLSWGVSSFVSTYTVYRNSTAVSAGTNLGSSQLTFDDTLNVTVGTSYCSG